MSVKATFFDTLTNNYEVLGYNTVALEVEFKERHGRLIVPRSPGSHLRTHQHHILDLRPLFFKMLPVFALITENGRCFGGFLEEVLEIEGNLAFEGKFYDFVVFVDCFYDFALEIGEKVADAW